jgi:polysaccharide biosynthesis/export protein
MPRSFLIASWCSVLVMVLACHAGAQIFSTQEDPLDSDAKETRTSQTPSPRAATSNIPLEGTVDPAEYFVGPSDVFAISVTAASLTTYTVAVTPEGSLIIPSVGEVSVAGLTLAEAKSRILEEIKKKFVGGKASATLLVPRPILVLVSGHVLNPGIYEATAVSRANKALELANAPRRGQSPDLAEKFIKEGSTRNIILKHRDGSESRVDIVKFMAMNQGRWNPFLREGDIIVVPRRDPARYVVAIYGEVNVPGRYEHVAGDGVRDLVNIAHGFTPLAQTDSLEFSRLSWDGSGMTGQILSWSSLCSDSSRDLLLEPGDRVMVKAKSDLREDYFVVVAGEVVAPGTYPITKNATRLSEIIRRAGGFTEFASLATAELSRHSVSPEDLDYERRVSLRGGTSADDSAYFVLETDLRIRKEIVNVDFVSLFAAGDSSRDVILHSGDYIQIPPVRPTIYVYGQVVSPGHVAFDGQAKLSDYLARAGGLTENARGGDIRIIKSSTRQWLTPEQTTIEPGDYIWVPKDPERPFSYYMTVLSQAATVLSVALGIAVLIVQAGK